MFESGVRWARRICGRGCPAKAVPHEPGPPLRLLYSIAISSGGGGAHRTPSVAEGAFPIPYPLYHISSFPFGCPVLPYPIPYIIALRGCVAQHLAVFDLTVTDCHLVAGVPCALRCEGRGVHLYN